MKHLQTVRFVTKRQLSFQNATKNETKEVKELRLIIVPLRRDRMTVQELINELEKIEDKNKRVLHFVDDWFNDTWEVCELTRIDVDEEQENENDILMMFG